MAIANVISLNLSSLIIDPLILEPAEVASASLCCAVVNISNAENEMRNHCPGVYIMNP